MLIPSVCAFILSRIAGMTGAWIGFAAGETLTLILLGILIRKKSGKAPWKDGAYLLLREDFGAAEILIDGRVVKTVKGGKDKWGQSEVVLVLDEKEAAEHTLEIRVTEEGKKFTVTAVGLQ